MPNNINIKIMTGAQEQSRGQTREEGGRRPSQAGTQNWRRLKKYQAF